MDLHSRLRYLAGAVAVVVTAGAALLGCRESAGPAASEPAPHIVFVTGDEEYRSEESMPMLARMLEEQFGFRTTICYSLNDEGQIDPNNKKSITGLEALESADLMVLFTRFRDLPSEQMEHFLKYVATGKPIVGFRTATHAFQFPKDSPYVDWNYKKIAELIGQHWITHHGHAHDNFLTDVSVVDGAKDHPILRGVEPFKCYSWLYHVDGGDHQLHGDSVPLLTGTSLSSSHKNNPKYPQSSTVAWTKSYSGDSGQTGRVFFTTLGHSYDFKDPNLRRLAINGILWALDKENLIGADGASSETVGDYDPANAGFGMKYKQGVTPAERTAGTK